MLDQVAVKMLVMFSVNVIYCKRYVCRSPQVYGFLMNNRRVYLIGERKQQVDTHTHTHIQTTLHTTHTHTHRPQQVDTHLTQHRVELRRLTLGGRCDVVAWSVCLTDAVM